MEKDNSIESPELAVNYNLVRVLWKLFHPYGLGIVLVMGIFFSDSRNVC